MNRQLQHDPLLHYASLAGAGLPAGERHLARSAARQRMARVATHSPGAASARIAASVDGAASVLADLTFTVTIGDGAPSVVFDDDAGTSLRDANPGDAEAGVTRSGGTKSSRGRPRRLTLLAY